MKRLGKSDEYFVAAIRDKKRLFSSKIGEPYPLRSGIEKETRVE